jgi:glycosyltransferase involved in cell wall biosynthesis
MGRALRILQVSTLDQGGGAEQVGMNLHAGFRELGNEAWLAVGYKRTTADGVILIDNDAYRPALARWGSRASRRVTGAGPGRVGAWLVDALAAATQPRRFLDVFRGREDLDMPASRRLLSLVPAPPDVVHCHNLHGGYFDLGVLSELSGTVPVFLTLHDMWTMTGHCAYTLGCERWRERCGRCPDLEIPPQVRRDSTAFNLERKRDIYGTSRIFVAAPSRWLLDRAKVSVLAPGVAGWRLVPYGVDLGTFGPEDRSAARARLGIEHGSKVVLYAANVGRANPLKDYGTIAEAVSRLIQRDPASRVVFLVVGGEGDARTEGPFRFVPYVPERSRLADYYRAADVFVHAAREDNFPNTVLEALACGTPVVATAVGGIPEEIEDGATGRLVPPRDPEAMAAALEGLLSDPGRLADMSRRAAASARSRFDLARQVREYLAWFEEVLEERESRTGVGLPP